MNLEHYIQKIKPCSREVQEKAQHKIDFKTKPLGSLGLLEETAVKLCLIQNSLDPLIENKKIIVFAGDHGITSEGISAFPSEVTPQMVLNFINGGAAINVLSKNNNIDLAIVDMGVNYNFNNLPGLIHKKIANGTANFYREQAMNAEQAQLAVEKGIEVFEEQHQEKNIDLLGLGDMGIGNTTSSAAIIAAVTGADPAQTTGRGTGIEDDTFNKKVKIIRESLDKHKPDPKNGMDILQKIGGFEIAGIAGAVLAAAAHKVPVVLDGIISTAGGIIAYILNKNVADYMFSGHKSIEQGQKLALDFIGLKPLIDLNLRLGEGTGAALAMNIIENSANIMREMASFEDAGVSNKS